MDSGPLWSLCVLLYGDYPDLACRCLGSWRGPLRCDAVAARFRDIRVGANEVSPAVQRWVRPLLSVWARQLPVWWYAPDRNVGKYPLMRRMFRQPDWAGPLVMWFDDDSYLEPVAEDPRWWESRELLLSSPEVGALGQLWRRVWVAGQPEWVATQPWYDPSRPVRVGGWQRFCTGGWWCSRRDVLEKLDWPIPELRHSGGDMLFGAALEHSGLRMIACAEGVRINADILGRHSRAPRRGIRDDPVIGSTYRGQPLSTDHQSFALEVERVMPCESQT